MHDGVAAVVIGTPEEPRRPAQENIDLPGTGGIV
jgi:hypothetical protein